MPCDSIQTNSVDLQITQPDVLKAALEAEGITVQAVANGLQWFDETTRRWVTFSAGTLTYQTTAGDQLDEAELVNRIKRTYSAQVVRTVAARMGWKTQQVAANTFTATRRAF